MKQHKVERRVMWGDLDSLGIVFYPRYYEWIDACGHLFFDSIGLNQGALWRERDIIFGLAETSCRHLLPARYHQKILILTHIQALETKTVLLSHRIRDAETDALLVKGLEKRICLDVSNPDRLTAIRIPEDIYKRLAEAGTAEEP